MELKIGQIAITGTAQGMWNKETRSFDVKRGMSKNDKKYQIFELKVSSKDQEGNWTNGKGLKIMLWGNTKVEHGDTIGLVGRIQPDNWINKEGKEVYGNMFVAYDEDMFTPAQWEKKESSKPEVKEESASDVWQNMIVVFGKQPRASKTSKKFKVKDLDFYLYSSKSSTQGTYELYASQGKEYVLLATFYNEEQAVEFANDLYDDIQTAVDEADTGKFITREEYIKKMKDKQMRRDEIELEYKIQNKELNAPRLTPSHIDSAIKEVYYHIVPNTTVTVCCLTLMNGFNVIGYSASASKDNFDESIGREIAYTNAREHIWQLEGYLLKDRLYKMENN